VVFLSRQDAKFAMKTESHIFRQLKFDFSAFFAPLREIILKTNWNKALPREHGTLTQTLIFAAGRLSDYIILQARRKPRMPGAAVDPGVTTIGKDNHESPRSRAESMTVGSSKGGLIWHGEISNGVSLANVEGFIGTGILTEGIVCLFHPLLSSRTKHTSWNSTVAPARCGHC